MDWGAWRAKGLSLFATLAFHVLVAGLVFYLPIVGLPSGGDQSAHATIGQAPEATPLILLRTVSGAGVSARPVLENARVKYRITRPEPALPSIESLKLPQMEANEPRATSAERGVVTAHCEVHIHQGNTGVVQAVDLGECTGDLEWQRVLMGSISMAATLVSPVAGTRFPPVRTWNFDTASISAEQLAEQLSRPD